MRMHRWAGRVAFLSLAAGAACQRGSSGPGFTAPAVTNVGTEVSWMEGSENLWALGVYEPSQGYNDLNGDGDTSDWVLFVYDLAAGTLDNQELALGTGSPFGAFLTASSALAAAGVSETDQGRTDLNGDGDTDDLVLHVYDRRTRLTTNTGMAVVPAGPDGSTFIGDGFVAFVVSEAAQGQGDLDGNGSADGRVLHVYDSRTTLPANVGRDIGDVLLFRDGCFGYNVNEARQGDLNGDGDVNDPFIPELYDVHAGMVMNLHIATVHRSLYSAGGKWVALVSEGRQGASDLNGDGDAVDGVYHAYDSALMTMHAIDASSGFSLGSLQGEDRIALTAMENDGIDHTGDGDQSDSYVAIYDPLTDTVLDTGLAFEPHAASLAFAGEQVGILVRETYQGSQDLNSDGDFDDDVVHVVDPVSGTAVNLRLDAVGLRGSDQLLQIARVEPSAGQDWNHDGDLYDLVVFLWDPVTLDTTNTRVASDFLPLDSSAERVLLAALEEGEERDLNQDGDRHDTVYLLHDMRTHANASLRIAGAGRARLTFDGRGTFMVYEALQGRDLNGDGDQGDAVLHVVRQP